MEKEQIIKALECCGTGSAKDCYKCPRNRDCVMTSMECAETLIREMLSRLSKNSVKRWMTSK